MIGAGAADDAIEMMRLQQIAEEWVQSLAALRPADAVTRFAANSAAAMVAQAAGRSRSSVRIARMAAVANHQPEALAALERAAADRDLELPYVLRNPEFDPIRSQPRFTRLVLRLHGSAGNPAIQKREF